MLKVARLSVHFCYVVAVGLLVVVPFLVIPENLDTQRMISALTLFAFSMIFISIAINDWSYGIQSDIDDKSELVYKLLEFSVICESEAYLIKQHLSK